MTKDDYNLNKLFDDLKDNENEKENLIKREKSSKKRKIKRGNSERFKLLFNMVFGLLLVISTIIPMIMKEIVLFDILYFPHMYITFWAVLLILGGVFVFGSNIYNWFNSYYKKLHFKVSDFTILGSFIAIIGGSMRMLLPLSERVPVEFSQNLPHYLIFAAFFFALSLFITNILWRIYDD